jgi:hypothetical protein
MYPELTIQSTEDWNTFAKPREKVELDIIVDPMIYRTADVFLRGKTGVGKTFGSSEQVRRAIKRNVDSIATFFDCFILSENLPIIDYGLTFDQNVGFDSYNFIEQCNQVEHVLISVHICGQASGEARQAALELMKNKTSVPEPLAEELREEMSALEYQWKPDLSPLGPMQERELPVNRFLYGAALFGAFAQKAGVGHMFQPKRSQVFLAASLYADSALAQDEEKLYQKLGEVMIHASGRASSMAELHGLPPFLPYLLSRNPKTPIDLLAKAVALRKTGMVEDYRNWRNGLIRDWREKGIIRAQYRRELSRIAQKIQKEFAAPASSNLELKVSMMGLDPSWKAPIDEIWSWIYGQLPGRRYMKLLTRLTLAQGEYEQLDKHIGTVWNDA